MPRVDKATFIQEMLSAHALRQKDQPSNADVDTSTPEPGTADWWREVAQGLQAELARLRAENERLAKERDDALAEHAREVMQHAVTKHERDQWQARTEQAEARVALLESALLIVTHPPSHVSSDVTATPKEQP